MFELVAVLCAIGVCLNFALGIFSTLETVFMLLLLVACDLMWRRNDDTG